eukprot:5691800-Prorocentrum_lima.AAC.1
MLAQVSCNLSCLYMEQGGICSYTMPWRTFKLSQVGRNHVANQGWTDIAPFLWVEAYVPKVRPVRKRQ